MRITLVNPPHASIGSRIPDEQPIDLVVRDEGEETARRLVRALARGTPLSDVAARRDDRRPRRVPRRLGADRSPPLHVLGEVKVILVGSTRAGDIVRDADLLLLYKRAGVQRFLLGMETTDAKTLDLIRKGSTTTIDREAIRRSAGTASSRATWVVGFEEERSSPPRPPPAALLRFRSGAAPLRDPAPVDAVMRSRSTARSSRPTARTGTTSIRCSRRVTCGRGRSSRG